MIEFRKYKTGDELRFEAIESNANLYPENAILLENLIWTVYDKYDNNEKILGICGLLIENGWAIIFLHINKFISKRLIIKAIKQGWRLFQSYKIPLKTYIQDCFEEGCRFAEHYGFKRLCHSRYEGYSLYIRK